MLFIRQLRWDEWNETHIARHRVTREEVEETCHGDYIVRQSYRGRLILIGPTLSGRMLTAVLDPEPAAGVYYPVTARAASRKERYQYQLEQGKEGS